VGAAIIVILQQRFFYRNNPLTAFPFDSLYAIK